MNDNCPLYPIEKRLKDCLDLIVETKINYYDPNAFRLNLNNCIQTLRTVTFVLQKNKPLFHNFDIWYKQWQDNMKQDTIMKWLIDSRNTIVKQGDLETYSKARVAVVESWYSSPVLEIDVQPSTETYNLAQHLSKATPDKDSYVVGLLRLERRWIDSKLPNVELIDALLHSFEILTKMLLDAHENLLNNENKLNCNWYSDIILLKFKLPSYLLAQEWDRTVWVDIASGNILKPTTSEINISHKDEIEAKQRYPDINKFSKNFKKSKSLEEKAFICFQLAKSVLKKDGTHVSMAIIGYSNSPEDLRQLIMKDRTEKNLVIHSLAADIEKSNANSIILINEIWLAPVDDAKLTKNSVESNSLKEALQLIAADSTGKELMYYIYFEKDINKKVHLKKEFYLPSSKMNLMMPIMEVWEKKRSS